LKRDTEDHPKVARLMKALGIPQPYAVGLLHMLWARTAKFAPRGDIGRYSDERIAEVAGWPGDPQQFVAVLEECGFLDPHRRCRYLVHDWPEHCEDHVHMRLARTKVRFADGTVPDMRRLSIKERKELEPFFVRTKSARRAHCRAVPSRAQPSNVYPNGDMELEGPMGGPPKGSVESAALEEGHPTGEGPADGPTPTDADAERPDPRKLLGDVKARLADTITRHAFATWFRPIEAARWDDGVFVIEVPSEQHREWIRTNYPDAIKRALAELGHENVRVKVVARARAPATLHSGGL
jgi:hypothetical protein